ncbi:SAM-dependent methyltransferase [Embleya sp. MST-111070]|uniref:SAM-dependent methyltransferase n=1 Tax=Embleya sp. MST-111070 TaxID=3398231 RepID=UPI003F734940
MNDHHAPDHHRPLTSGVDTTRPSPARMYDYYLDGKNHYSVDREAAERILGETPNVREAARENRAFLQRAVRALANLGIDQFVDLGAGLPTEGNVHDVAQAVNPGARVVYVDNDPVVLAHGRALLAGRGNTTTVIMGDMRQPKLILEHPDTRALIDFGRPVAVLFVATLHFVPDDEEPHDMVRAYREALAPGSHLVISHATTQGPSADHVDTVVGAYEKATAQVTVRSKDEIAAFFDGFELVDPGLTRPGLWRPDGEQAAHTDWLFAGVGRLCRRRDRAAPGAASSERRRDRGR